MWGLMSFSQQSVQLCFIHFRDLTCYTNLHTYIHPQLIPVFYFSSVMVYWSRSHINRAYSCDSYAIGGLAGGESKDSFWRVVAQCTAALPEDKPRYVMVQIFFIKSTYIVQTNLNSCELGGSSFHIFPVMIFPQYFFSGCWLSTGYCSLQCFRCRHVWLCLSYSYCSLWHSSCTWGDSFLWT